MPTTISWFLVADRSRARIYQGPPDKNGHFSTQANFEHPEGRLLRQEMESDDLGQSSMPGHARGGMEPQEAPEHREARKFADKLCNYLDAACRKNQFNTLVIVAPPFFLGVLRDHLTAPLKSCLVGEVDKELMPFTDAEIQSRLAEMVSAGLPARSS